MSNPKINAAYWLSPSTGLVMLSENWLHEEGPPLDLDSEQYTLSKLRPAPLALFAEVSGFYVEGPSITFLFFTESYPHINWAEVSLYVAGDFNEWESAVGDPAWEMKAYEYEGRSCLRLSVPITDCTNGEQVRFKFVTSEHYWLPVNSLAPNIQWEEGGISNYHINPSQTGKHCFLFQAGAQRPIVNELSLIWEEEGHAETHTIMPGIFFYQLDTDLPLGAYVEGGQTVFRLFAPRAHSVKLHLHKDLEQSEIRIIDMKLANATTWQAVVRENLDNWYYFYRVDGRKEDPSCHFDPSVNILDPYALACASQAGPGIIIDRSRMPKIQQPFVPPAWQDLVIMEGHVRDLVQQAPIELDDQDRLGFKGLAAWIRSDGNYVKKMGVNALELQPIQQFDSPDKESYHWGYMTTNYFSPCSWYGSSPENGSQVDEFHDLVAACHESGLAVILDVVYNHVGLPEALLYIDKEYYFDIDCNGNLLNWSGCGNTLRASAAMSRHLIIESLKHLVSAYDVDGFRFDLAELLGIEVLVEIEQELKKIKPGIILIAEPWSFRGHIAKDLKHTGYMFWNDGYRDFMADFVHGNGDIEGLKYFMGGSLKNLSRFPSQSVNYVESHDDFCWLDKITENSDNDATNPTDNDRLRTHLMIAVLMSSLGTPMIAQGQDLLRSKGGHHNTYLRGDINAIDYSRIDTQAHTHTYFKDWIALRHSSYGQCLRLYSTPSEGYLRFYEVEGTQALAVLYNADSSKDHSQLLFAVNPHADDSVVIALKDLQSPSWMQIADQEKVCLEGMNESSFSDSYIELPPLNCGLWVNPAHAS